jgi:hypothetical protein
VNRSAAGEQPQGFAAWQAAAQADADVRKEPTFAMPDTGAKTSSTIPDSAAYEQFANQPPWVQQSGPLHRNPISRAALMIGIFAIGAAAGLAATWWMTQPPDAPPAAAAVRKLEPVARAPVANPESRASVGSPAGINPGELPYDGVPPGAVGKIAPTATAAATVTKTPQRDGATTAGQNAAAAAVAAPLPAEKAQQAIAEAPADSRDNASALREKSYDKKVAKATHRRTPPRMAKDKEIERIKQQAADELKKKSRNRSVTQEARYTERGASRQDKDKDASASAASGHSKRAMLARCENASNFILRERCKWQICSGMWGKNGCPSYERQASVVNY